MAVCTGGVRRCEGEVSALTTLAPPPPCPSTCCLILSHFHPPFHPPPSSPSFQVAHQRAQREAARAAGAADEGGGCGWVGQEAAWRDEMDHLGSLPHSGAQPADAAGTPFARSSSLREVLPKRSASAANQD